MNIAFEEAGAGRSRRAAPRILVNLGSGQSDAARLPAIFADWRHLRVDIDTSVTPDIVASMTDLSPIPAGAVQAVWASHCLEHLFRHEVPVALAEIARILSPDGFACLRVPDLQTVAGVVAEDRMHEVLYTSKAGPVTAHDVLFGFGPELAAGHTAMSHRTGFTPTILVSDLQGAGFSSLLVRRSTRLELVAVAQKQPWQDSGEPGRLLDALGL
jgi:SAM-dependent methyltransferase